MTLRNVDYTGAITASVSRHRVPRISKENCEELGEVVNTPAPVCNNGVIVVLEEGSVWNITADCYLSSLTISGDAEVRGRSADGSRAAYGFDARNLYR